MRTVLTYGTFDLFHIGHLRLFERLAGMADRVIVGVSTDEFNLAKGKHSMIRFEDRIDIVRSVRFVDDAFPESSWDQKRDDIKRFSASALVMGDDWRGRFDALGDVCEVIYLPRTEGVSSSALRLELDPLTGGNLDRVKHALDLVSEFLDRLT